MQLEVYIKDLLYRYDCVVVPDLGAFLTQKVSAKIHETTHVMYPPKKLLSFNEQLQKNDGLLTNYIAEVEKIPYEAATKKIARHVKSIKSYLVEGEIIHFEDIGDLSLNKESKITFEPSERINFLTDSFGLAHIDSQHVSRETYIADVETLEEKTPITISKEKRSYSWLNYAAAAIVVLGLSTFGAYEYYSNSIESHNQLAQEEANSHIEERVQEATFVINNPLPPVTLQVEKQAGNYHVVAGAFRVKANSEKKVKQLRAKGYKARTIGKNRYGLHEVVYSSYDNRSDATAALYQIRREHNRDAWLLIKALD